MVRIQETVVRFKLPWHFIVTSKGPASGLVHAFAFQKDARLCVKKLLYYLGTSATIFG